VRGTPKRRSAASGERAAGDGVAREELTVPSDTILVTCPNCGDQRVACHQMSLVISEGEQHAYCFRCSECGEVVIRLCDQGVAAKLTAIGVRVSLAGRSDDHPPLTVLDAIRFERLLSEEDLLVRLITGE
jgi:predicted RNA-binding Zn-ribbon protein involved in translation (DUF1610 family)